MIDCRIHYYKGGNHVHMSIFTGKKGNTLGKAGDICMTVEEFIAFRRALVHNIEESFNVEFIRNEDSEEVEE